MTRIPGPSVRRRKIAGFSMIDALIAIVVLATALLALALLQGTMTRNAADSRARSQIAAYSESLIEQMRAGGYSARALASSSASAGVATTISPTSGTSSQQAAATAAQTAAGVSNLSTTITATQYAAATNGTSTTYTPTTGNPNPNSGAYKQVDVKTTWTDAAGQPRHLVLDTIISPVEVDNTNNTLVDQQQLSAAGGMTPRVRQSNPGNTTGVIPIAISNSQDAAATNPKPIMTNTGSTFSTVTYVAQTDPSGGNLIQSRVDTKVVQCGCMFGGAATTSSNASLASVFQQPYGPTYWDGTHYVSPAPVPGTTASATGVDPSVSSNDVDCDICCRDRNDTSGNTVKYDSFSGDPKKYAFVTGANGQTTLQAVTSGSFQQACRLIRVNGVYAAATEAHNYFFSLLPTDDCEDQGSSAAPVGCTSSLPASDTVPSDTTETTYATFVQKYLLNTLIAFSSTSGTAQSGWGSASPQTGGSQSASLFTGAALNQPANITINLPNTVSRWLYARGLYIDHLETTAQQALANAIANCPATDSASLQNCGTLAVLPFTTVNMTELANWSTNSTNPGVISVSNLAVIGGDETNPKRGNVTVPGTQTGSGSPTAYAIAATYVTNSGLTGLTINQANSPYDINNPVFDQRQFTVTAASSGGGGGNAVYFDVNLTGLPWMANITNVSLDPTVAWSGTAAQLGTPASGTSVGYLSGAAGVYLANYVGSITVSGIGNNQTTTVLPNAVSTTITPAGLTLTVQNFNNYDNLGTETINCTAAVGGEASSATITNATRCYNYQVDTSRISIDGVPVTGATVVILSGTTDGGMKEGAVITIPAGISSTINTIAGANNITVPFTLQNVVTPSGTCACTKSSCSGYTYTPSVCPD
jgi:Tfp pilus assembly protein PilV